MNSCCMNSRCMNPFLCPAIPITLNDRPMLRVENPVADFGKDLGQGNGQAERQSRDGQAIQVVTAVDALWVEEFLLKRYASHYASLSRMAATGELDRGVQVFLAREEGELVSALLFRRDGARVQVLNEVTALSAAEIQRFARYVFARWPEVGVICFKAIRTDLRKAKFPFQRFNHLEDFVISLPASADAYHAMLGPSLRKTLRTYGNKIRRMHPTFSHEVHEAADIDEQHVRAILAFSRARIAAKGKKWGLDEAECQRIVALARTCGLVSVIFIDGRVCAGAVSFRAGDDMFMRVCSHDPAYDDLRLGTLVRYCALEASIERGARECHLLWGRQAYKYQFMAEPRELDNLTMYRSWAQMLVHRRLAFHNIRQAAVRTLKLAVTWLRERDRRLTR
jgi:CelD/BcsL family acetyltransferase involved in cellulose biosynthesis